MTTHVVPRSNYFAVYVVLLVLLVLTAGLGEMHLGRWNVVAALSISVAKTVLIVLFFMHLRYTRGVPRLFSFAGVLWLSLLIGLTMCDVLTRPQFTQAPIVNDVGPANASALEPGLRPLH